MQTLSLKTLALVPGLQALRDALFSRPSRCLRLRLAPGQLCSAEVAAGTRIVCEGGRLWLTLDGDPEDVVLAAGEAGRVIRSGRLVAQGL